MDVTFVLEESGVTATVEVPCEADVAAAKEVACTALAVSPASVEMRIGTQVLEGTCRLQDTAFDAGVQVVLSRCCANIKCPAEYSEEDIYHLTLSRCGALCLLTHAGYVTGLDTETFSPTFNFKADIQMHAAPHTAAVSRCKTRCYLACKEGMHEVALPGGEVLRKVDGPSYAVFACGNGVVSKGQDGVSVYDEDLTLLRTLSHEGCSTIGASDCGGWVITSSCKGENARLWDVSTGDAVACVPAGGWNLALSRSASVFAVVCSKEVQLYDWSGAARGSFKKAGHFYHLMHFTPSGKYLIVGLMNCSEEYSLHQYDVATMSCVRVFSDVLHMPYAISPCSRVVVFANLQRDIVTRHLYPY